MTRSGATFRNFKQQWKKLSHIRGHHYLHDQDWCRKSRSHHSYSIMRSTFKREEEWCPGKVCWSLSSHFTTFVHSSTKLAHTHIRKYTYTCVRTHFSDTFPVTQKFVHIAGTICLHTWTVVYFHMLLFVPKMSQHGAALCAAQSQGTSHVCAILNHFRKSTQSNIKNWVQFSLLLLHSLSMDQLLHTTVWADSHTPQRAHFQCSATQKHTMESGLSHRDGFDYVQYIRERSSESVCVYPQTLMSTVEIPLSCTSHKTTEEQLLKFTWNKTRIGWCARARWGWRVENNYTKHSDNNYDINSSMEITPNTTSISTATQKESPTNNVTALPAKPEDYLLSSYTPT